MKHRERGNTILEFTLVGIPLMFVMISIFEISRGMWIYHTLEYGIKQGGRYIATHGQNCDVYPNNCAVTIGDISREIVKHAGGLLPQNLTLTFCGPSTGDMTPCTLGAGGPNGFQTYQCTGAACLTDAKRWPPEAIDRGPSLPPIPAGNRVGLNDAVVVGKYPFSSVLAFLWPGAHAPSMSSALPSLLLPAQARERIEF